MLCVLLFLSTKIEFNVDGISYHSIAENLKQFELNLVNFHLHFKKMFLILKPFKTFLPFHKAPISLNNKQNLSRKKCKHYEEGGKEQELNINNPMVNLQQKTVRATQRNTEIKTVSMSCFSVNM